MANMDVNCRIEGNEYVITLEDGDDVYEGCGASYEEAGDDIEAQMLADQDDDED